MKNPAYIEELKNLVQQEDALSVGREVNELRQHFDDYILEEERKEQVASLEAKVRGVEYEAKDFKPLKDEFYELYTSYKERKRHQQDAKNAVENANLKHKRELIDQLKKVIQEEENIGAAYASQKEIQEKWKLIGDIPREKRDDIQKEYSRLLEDFFYHMKIYRDLKDHDLKRNYQLKLDLIQQLEKLKENSSVKEIETSLKALQHEWEEIGPVMNEEWEKLKTLYWENVRGIYEKINHFYDERRNSLTENLNKKKELLDETKALVSKTSENTSTKLWEDATNQLLEFQNKWKTIGFGPKKENEAIWQEFRAECDSFFAKKKEFFGEVHEQFNKVAEEKKKLIEQALELKDSTDWKNTADKLVQLQQKWKKAGHAGQKLEQKLWSEFRTACDAFFNSRQKHFEEQDKELVGNLDAKKAIIAEIENYSLSENKQQALSDLRNFSNSFNAVGKVPMKEKDAVYKSYKTAIDNLYSQLKLEGEEKDKILFEARLETLAGSPDAARLYSKEKAEIRHQIDHLKADILQFENNLGFFARSKGADALRKEVETKIAASQQKIETLKRKLKMIPNE